MQKQNRKETSILKFLRYIHSYAKNVRTITNLQNFHTYIQILQNSNLILDIIMLSRKEQGLFVYFFVCFLTFSTLCLSPTHKMENLKTFKKKNNNNKGTIDDSKYLCLFHSLKVYVFCRSCHSVQEN